MSHTNDFVITMLLYSYDTIVTILTTVTFYLQKMLKEANVLNFPILSSSFFTLGSGNGLPLEKKTSRS